MAAWALGRILVDPVDAQTLLKLFDLLGSKNPYFSAKRKVPLEVAMLSVGLGCWASNFVEMGLDKTPHKLGHAISPNDMTTGHSHSLLVNAVGIALVGQDYACNFAKGTLFLENFADTFFFDNFVVGELLVVFDLDSSVPKSHGGDLQALAQIFVNVLLEFVACFIVINLNSVLLALD